MIVPLLLAGGAGTGLWPYSRALHPKQLLPLVGERTLLQDALERLRGVAEVDRAVVVGLEAHRFLVAEQLRALDLAPKHLLEPEPRDTAVAVAAGALAMAGDPLVLVTPTDLTMDAEPLRAAIRAGVGAAEAGHIVLFGVSPARPDPAFGYLHAPGDGVRPVLGFVEKPADAAARVAAGDLWNSGLVLARASTIVGELDRYAPAVLVAARQALAGARPDLDFVRLDRAAFARSPAVSLDRAVLERTDRAVVVPLDAAWSDVSTWSALLEARPADPSGTVCLGDVLAIDTSGSYLHAGSRLVAAVGLRDVVVVETADAVLVAARDRLHEVRAVVDALEAAGRSEGREHRRVARPWGAYEALDRGDGYQVKRITVRPGASLSLQTHTRRAEHWVVVRGTARVTRGEEVFLLEANASTYIPVGVRHRLENAGAEPLEIVEVQSGAYLGEDDIVRHDDRYGR